MTKLWQKGTIISGAISKVEGVALYIVVSYAKHGTRPLDAFWARGSADCADDMSRKYLIVQRAFLRASACGAIIQNANFV